LNSYLENIEEAIYAEEDFSFPINVFTYETETNKINIQLDTVHSVKGETHTATLYLETFKDHLII
jgi:DNA helicase-2/ATP-dependent DNA helicase PcrA